MVLPFSIEQFGLLIGIATPIILGISYLLKHGLSIAKKSSIHDTNIVSINSDIDDLNKKVEDNILLHQQILIIKEKIQQLEAEEIKASHIHKEMFDLLQKLSKDVNYMKGRMEK